MAGVHHDFAGARVHVGFDRAVADRGLRQDEVHANTLSRGSGLRHDLGVQPLDLGGPLVTQKRQLLHVSSSDPARRLVERTLSA